MSLKTKILTTLFMFMVMVFVLLTVNLLLELPGNTRRETQRQAELVARLVNSWVIQSVEEIDPDHPVFWDRLGVKLDRAALFRSFLLVQPDGKGGVVVRVGSRGAEPPSPEEVVILKDVMENGNTRVRGAVAYVAVGSLRSRVVGARFVLPESSSAVVQMAQTVQGVVVIMAIGILVILLTSYILLNRFVLRPLNRLSEASAAVAEGDFSRLLPEPASRDEVARTFTAFNLMLRRIQESNKRMMGEIHKSHEELKDTQTKLVKAQRLSSTGTLAAGIAHEVNNPLSGLMNMSKKLKEGGLDEARRREYVDLIIEGLERIRATMEKILLFTPRPSEIRPVVLGDVLEKVRALVDHRLAKEEIGMELDGLSGLPKIMGDPAELQQVFLNLVLNAVDACVAGEGRVRISGSINGKFIDVTVADNGEGMEEAEIQNAFMPFHTSKAEGKGTGLGLSVAKSIVEAHGGDIYLESARGKGTQVHVMLPLERESS